MPPGPAARPGPTPVAVVGCGAALEYYLLDDNDIDDVAVVACADLNPDRAARAARRFGARACGPDDVLADPGIDVVLNLTPPRMHADVTLAALAARKSVYSEKPLAMTLDDAARILSAADRAGTLVGCAPDTFLGPTGQLARAALDSGAIGEPRFATAAFMGAGSADKLAEPDFPGTMLDVGVYYVTALVHLLGPVRTVTGVTSRLLGAEDGRPTRRRARSDESPTHVAGILEFASGVIATVVAGFGLGPTTLPHLEISGEEATLALPNPNFFDGPVAVVRPDGERRLQAVPGVPCAAARGAGLASLARGLRTGAPHAPDGRFAYHVLEVMLALAESSLSGTSVAVRSGCTRPEPFDRAS